jgi:hypothetical protein
LSVHKTKVLIDASGCGAVSLSRTPRSQIKSAEVVEGDGQVAIEAIASMGSRLMVTGGSLDKQVTVKYELEGKA